MTNNVEDKIRCQNCNLIKEGHHVSLDKDFIFNLCKGCYGLLQDVMEIKLENETTEL